MKFGKKQTNKQTKNKQTKNKTNATLCCDSILQTALYSHPCDRKNRLFVDSFYKFYFVFFKSLLRAWFEIEGGILVCQSCNAQLREDPQHELVLFAVCEKPETRDAYHGMAMRIALWCR